MTEINTESRLNVWIVDDDASVRWVLEKALAAASISTRSFEDASEFLAAADDSLPGALPDVLITDIRMPGMDGLEMMRRLESAGTNLPVIVMTAHSDLDSAIAAYQGGAFEYLPKPFDVDQAVDLVLRAARSVDVTDVKPLPVATSLSSIIGRAPAMQEVFRVIGRLSGSSMNVLITGESGTGKELVAQALHEHSPRVNQPFVAFNTTAIASDLLESELFGHERGAFTGADRKRIGRFEEANGGTVFLDEIGDMSADLQTRLLRILAEGEFYRVGGQAPIQVDVRVIAATNRNLTESVESGTFREDLFHRINVIRIETPPLRERVEDIPLLLEHYLAQAAKELKIPPKTLTADAADLLQGFAWPGNVRQLVNVCRRLTIIAAGNEIRIEDIPEEFGGASTSRSANEDWLVGLARWAEHQLTSDSGRPLLESAAPDFERTLIRAALARANGRRQEAARLLGIGRNTLTRKIRDLNIDT
jgi:two-component system nitrogen regulation response regulator GlnG